MGTNTDQTITAAELAALTGFVPSHLCNRRHDLPQPTTVHTHQPGRPAKYYGLHELADFAYTRTAHLSEAECRLILALSGRAAATSQEQPQ